MAWHCVVKIKNDLNEFTFATFPLEQYSGPQGGSATSIGWSHYREQNSAGGHADFMRASAIAEDLATQVDIPRLEVGSSYVKMVFGTLGGSGVDLRYVQTAHSGTQYGVDIQPYVYRNMSGTRMLVSSSSYDTSKDTILTWTWGLAINEDTEEIYLMTIRAWIRWYYGIGVYAYYDRATASATILDNNSNFNLWDMFKDSIPSGGGGDPYEPGGNSTSGGGENATFDLTSDNINVPTLPSISASGAGLLTLYQVSLQNMRDFAAYLWSPIFDVDTLKKLFNDPMDAIISLGMLPFTPTGGSASNIFIGTSDSGVSAIKLATQYYDIDMGSVLLDTFYDSALDLNPYTKVELYLPYCGTVSINPDEFDGKSIHVVYHVDILTGACVVFVEDGTRVLVQSQGNILTSIPYTAKDFKAIFGAVLGDAAAAGAAIGALATGGISALAGGIGLVSHVALNTVNSKVNTPHGGQCASTAGFLSVQKPYLIITRPAQCLPENNADYQGYPAYVTETVGNLTGFIKVSEAHFDGFTCTDGELKEIDRLLKEGVYVQ